MIYYIYMYIYYIYMYIYKCLDQQIDRETDKQMWYSGKKAVGYISPEGPFSYTFFPFHFSSLLYMLHIYIYIYVYIYIYIYIHIYIYIYVTYIVEN